MERSRPTRLLLMSETEVDLPIWDRSPTTTASLDPEELGISSGLAARLREWNQRWQFDPERPQGWSRDQLERLRRTGLRLARQLQEELIDVEILVYDRGREVPIREVRHV